MKAVDVFFWAIVIIPIFLLFFSKIAFSLWFLASIIGSFFNIFTYLGVNCKVVGGFTEIFLVFFLWMLVLFIYNKVKI